MASKENSTIRMEPELKAQAAALFKSLGMDLSTATRIFYIQALRCNGLPFEVKLDEPNSVTRAAFDEGDRLLSDPNALRFTNVDDLFEELNS
ncbi:MAG: type II toxin-antitoxin system RelB/DinJ family antitoxin [Clostridiales bacterium]|nr:type II toxin-antitoxin system RelB/DinJ family antitoxin [Clostridiales bacterium]